MKKQQVLPIEVAVELSHQLIAETRQEVARLDAALADTVPLVKRSRAAIDESRHLLALFREATPSGQAPKNSKR